MKEILEDFENIKNIYNNAKVDTSKKLEQALFQYIQPIFDKYPTVDNLSFLAFTPYFADGDVCTYSTHLDPQDF